MDLTEKMWDTFSFESRSLQELIEISSCIDAEKSSKGYLSERGDDLATIAAVVVALINEKATSIVGEKLNAKINSLIVQKNLEKVTSENGKMLFEKMKQKHEMGTYKVRNTVNGHMFSLYSADGNCLIVSEIYSKLENCLSGIISFKKNAIASIEDQTIENYQEVRNPKYEIYQDKKGEYRFRLKLKNGQILAVSSGYRDKNSCLEAIENVKKSAESNDVEKD